MADSTVKSCSNCGAELRFEPGTLNLKCAHCGAENTIAVEAQELTTVPDYIVPLVADEKTLRRTVQSFLTTGHLVPDDILDAAEFTKMELFYAPAYVFNGSYTATWTASFGYDRQEHYTDYENRTENGITRRVAVAKTKTVTDWRPVNGTDMGNFNFPCYAGASQPPSVAGLVDGMSWSDGKPFDTAFISGYRTEDFEKTADKVFGESGQARMNAIIDSGVKSHAQGDRQRDWNWKANFEKSVTSYFVPIGWACYSYGGKEYNYWIDGIDASRFVADKPPVDSKRRWSLVLSYVPFLVMLPVMGMVPKDQASGGGLAITAALVWGGLRHFAIVRHSKARRTAALARKIAEEGDRHELTGKQEKALETAYSDVKTGFLANTSRDRKLIPAIVAGLIAVSVTPPIWKSIQQNREQAAAEQRAAERNAEIERRQAESRRQQAERELAQRQQAEREEAERGATTTTDSKTASDPAAAAPVASATASPRPAAEAASTLDKGHPERKIVLDFIRPMIEKLLNPPVTFEVDTIRRAGDYAYLRLTPIRPTGEAIDVSKTNLKDKNAGVLTQLVLKKEGNGWALVSGGIGTRMDWAARSKFCDAPYPKDLTGTCN